MPVIDYGRNRRHWSADGTELYFIAGGKLMAAPVCAGGSLLEAGTPFLRIMLSPVTAGFW
jgi:hypothetical protein